MLNLMFVLLAASLFLLISLCAAQSPDQLHQIEREAIRLSEEIKAEYWAVSAKSGGSLTPEEILISHRTTTHRLT